MHVMLSLVLYVIAIHSLESGEIMAIIWLSYNNVHN